MTPLIAIALLAAPPASAPFAGAPPGVVGTAASTIADAGPEPGQQPGRGRQAQRHDAEHDEWREASWRTGGPGVPSGSIATRRVADGVRRSDGALPARGVERVARDGEGQEDAEDADQAEDPCQDRAEEGEPVGRHRDRLPWILAQLRALSPTALGMVGSLGYLTIFGGMCLGGLLPRRWPRTAFLTGLTVSFSGIALLMLCYEAS